MRPLQLTMKAFGPYADVQEVDFRKLKEHTFFLIHGPTGAGKSSILDAICFALYGETSGKDRLGKQMRSDHAAQDCLTEVRFTFALKGEIFRVHRVPEQERPRKVGAGMVQQKHVATMWCLGQEGDDLDQVVDAPDESGGVVASSASKVTGEVIERIGFSVDQFRQVVVLPQGKFRRLLGGDTRTRQEILAVLFQTERYRRVEEALKEKHKELKKGLEDVTRQRQQVLARAGVDDEAALGALVAVAEQELRALEEQEQERRADRDLAEGALRKGREDQLRLDELREAAGELAALQARAHEVQAQKVELEGALRAGGLRDLQGQRDGRQEEAVNTAARVAELEELAATARKRRDRARTQHEEQVALEPDRAAAGRRLEDMERLGETVAALERLRTEATEAGQRLDLAAGQEQEGDRKKCELAGLLEGLGGKLEEARDRAARLEHYERLLEDANKALSLRNKLDADRAAHERQQEKLEQAELRLGQAKKAREADLAALEELTVKWDNAHTARLAEQLEPGVPCPTCGSPKHPDPARCEDGAPGVEALRAQREAVERAGQHVEEARKAREELHLERKVHETGQLHVVESLGEDMDLPLAELEARRDETSARARAAGEAANQVLLLEQDQAGRRAELTAAEVALGEAVKAAAAARTARDRAQAQLDLKQQEVPAELLEPESLAAATQQARERLEALAQKLKQAAEQRRLAGVDHAGLAAEHQGARKVAEQAELRAARARDEFLQRLADAEFADEQAYAAALREDPKVEQLDQLVRQHARALASAQDRHKRAEEAAAGLDPPPLEQLEAATQEAATRFEQILELRLDLTEKQKTRRALVAELESMAGQQSGLEKQYGIFGRLADVAKGSNARRLSFERYVLTLVLDDVLQAASLRFSRMTRGRFDLSRVIDGAQGRLAGLDLEVEDSHTGKRRPVSTLSGGEGFLASLSLALGLVDVVQRESGGIRLDAMFVDEGFGSLDTEALDQCLRVLQDLQSGGRLVGIISHVDELKRSLFVRLEVRPSRRGSVATFVLP